MSAASPPAGRPAGGAAPREAAGRSGAGRKARSRTWWGQAWVDALEQRARLDPNRLPRGRSYARSGAVGELIFAPGEARAPVHGRRVRPYTVRVRVRPFTGEEWDRVLDAIATQLGHAAALLDGELPPEVVGDVAAAGLDLLPGAGEVGPRCTCPDDADPCKHAAAVCYLVADALDADPFVLLLLRGRTRQQVLAGVRTRRRPRDETPAAKLGSGATSTDGADDREGVDARTVLAAPPPTGAIPPPPMPPQRPGHPAVLPVDPPPQHRALRDDLLSLAADAAARAWGLAIGLSADGGLDLDADADLARRADRALGTPTFAGLATRSGLSARELARWGLAWRHGGATGLELLRADWDPPSCGSDAVQGVEAARVALGSMAGSPCRIVRNRITAGGLQLRLGRDGLWYPYARSAGEWEPAGPPQLDPARAAELL